ncbi:unnamed protein product [Cylicocyclus nassatus]|uniref:Uncharacterized protein n=1 Tax=Cylicocyclus nassatus TaxID=53992 RepID=A0AA36HGV2_CYLNA|nr:unnamed protein product [Cylicocyclus nassatus]
MLQLKVRNSINVCSGLNYTLFISMGSLQLLCLCILFFIATAFVQKNDRFKELKSTNPILRYWAQTRLRKKLAMLNALARKKETDSQKYRNCYFSPVQCQLPVLIAVDPLANAIKPDLQQDMYTRFRRY